MIARLHAAQVVNTLLMLLGGMMWGHVIGTFCGVVANMSPHITLFNNQMDDLNGYIKKRKLLLAHLSNYASKNMFLSYLPKAKS